MRPRFLPQAAGYRICDIEGSRWRTLDGIGMPEWTDDEDRALCFTVREHAELFAQDDHEQVFIEQVGGYVGEWLIVIAMVVSIIAGCLVAGWLEVAR